MSLLRNIGTGLRALFRRDQVDRELDEELRTYHEMAADEKMKDGMSRKEALRSVRLERGSLEVSKEIVRSGGWESFVETCWQDLRFGLRLLRLSPAFTLVALLSLALGIGANTAIFQLIDTFRLRTLPVKNPQELAIVRTENLNGFMGETHSPYPELSFPLFEQIRHRQQAFSAIAAWGADRFNLSTGGEVHYAKGLWVSGDFFPVLGVQPLLGRLIAPSDDISGCGSAGVNISYAFWQDRYAGELSAVGKSLTLNGHRFEIIGVTPASFHGVSVGDSFDVAAPICAEPVIQSYSRLNIRHSFWLAAIGRLKPVWSIEKATAQLKAISAGALQETVPSMYDADAAKHYLTYQIAAYPASTGFSYLREQTETPLWLLLGLSGLVLLIACANLANLMLARASAREREIVVRTALGAGRFRLIRQLLSESLLLSLAGTLCGTILAVWLSRLLVSMMSTPSDPVFLSLTVDWRVLGFAAGLAVLTTVFFGLLPAFRVTRTSPSAALKSSGRGLTAGRERFGLRRVLATAQVALSLVLLVGALLFVRSFRKLVTLDAGFRQDGVLVAQVSFTRLNLPSKNWPNLKREVLDRLRALPKVQSAANASYVPIGGDGSNDAILGDSGDEHRGFAWLNYVSPGFFKTLETPLVAGRDFDDRDTDASPKIAIVNEEFVREFLGGGNALGKTFRIWAPPGMQVPAYEVVGVVKDAKYLDLREKTEPIMYFPLAQYEYPGPECAILMRSEDPLAGVTASVKTVLHEINPAIEVDFRVLKTQIHQTLLQDKLMAALSSFFGLLSALLAAIGLYGVISYLVTGRTNEIGIRVALGAQRCDVLRMVLREAGVVTVAGLLLGAGLALAAAQAARSLLFELKPSDPVTFVFAILSLSVVALLAGFLPAHRASRVDPMIALRYE